MNHLKLALRQLKLRPGLSFVVITMLALGIGATTAMFSLYHQILLRPMPVPEPDRLVNLAAPGPKPGGGITDVGLNGNREAQFSYPMFRDLEKGQTGFTGIAAYIDYLANLSFEDRPTSGRIYLVSGSYFDVLNVKPALGRLLGPGDDPRVGESAVAVLSYEFWQRVFGGEPSVIGKTLTVNGQALEIVGVAPQGFRGTNIGVRTDVFVPLTLAPTAMAGLVGPQMFEARQGYWIYLFARLKSGVTLERAAAQLNGVYAGVLNDVEAAQLNAAQLPDGTLDRFRARQLEFSPGGQGRSVLAGQAERPLTLLLGVTALVLLIVCVNIANLLLARGAARSGEMATRASLGASRGWLVRQLLGESLVLIAIGGLSSLAVAAALVRLIAALLPNGIVIGLAPQLSTTAMLFAAGASVLTVVVFGLVPAVRVSNANPALAMRADASRSGGSRAAVRFRGVLTMAQIAFSMLLLVLAGLFTKSLMNVAAQDIGMDSESIVTFSVTPRMNAYSPERLADYYDRLEDALKAQPGVVAVGSGAMPLLGNFALRQPFGVQGFEAAPGVDTTTAYAMVGTDFFGALGIPLLAGRTFTQRDDASSPLAVIVNESFARKFNLGLDAVGKRVGGGATPANYPFEIVGIVADAKFASVKNAFEPVIYVSRYQTAGGIQAMFYHLRASAAPEGLLAMIPRVAAEIDPDVPVTNLATMTATINGNVYVERLLSMLSAGFAALATLLAGVGLYGVLAYNITQRTRELGLRLALGAPPARLRTMVLKQVGVMALIGTVVGLVAALGLGRAAESLLFGLSGRDPVVFGAAVAVLAAVVFAASWVPAWRASRIAPTEALRYQ